MHSFLLELCVRGKLTDPRGKNTLMGASLDTRGVLPPASFSGYAAQGLSQGCELLFSTEPPARPLGSIAMQAAVASECTIVSNLTSLTSRVWVSALHAQMDTASSASTCQTHLRVAPDWLHGSMRTRDRRTEARTGPSPLCSRNGRPHPGFPGCDLTTSTLATHETASSGRPSERGGDGTPRRVPGSDQPQSSCTPTPLLHRRGSPTVPTTKRSGRAWTQRESHSSLVDLHQGKGLVIVAQQLHQETWECWNRRVPPSGLWLCGTPAAANVFLLCGHDSVSPRTAQDTCPA